MVNDLLTAWWLFGGLLEGLMFFWPVSLLLGLHALAASASWAWSVPNYRRFLVLLTPFVWPVLILLVGAAWRHLGPRHYAAMVPIVSVEVLFAIQVILSVGLVYALKGGRWAAAATSLLAGWCGVLSLLIAKMALTNVWI
jgi:hypothetical protein